MPVAFMVILGDCVQRGTPGEHEYFKRELWYEIALPFPVFYVVGNHDVDEEKFPLSRFEETYGPSIFSFEYQECLFIILRILGKPYPTLESLTFLEQTLKQKRKKNRRVFVFMHRPPKFPGDVGVKGGFKNEREFMALCDTYDVDYVFAGHYHGYFRAKLNDVVYLVTGGGGARLRDPYFKTHHVVIMTVNSDRVYERLLSMEKDVDIEDIAEHTAIADVYPVMHKYWVLTLVINIVLVAGWLLTLKGALTFIRELRKK